MRRSLMFAVVAVLGIPGVALAAEEAAKATGSMVPAYAVIATCFGPASPARRPASRPR